MALRLSTRLRNLKVGGASLKEALSGGEIRIFTGAQPASADNAETGTLLCTLTNNASSRTAEVRASATITLSGTASGSVDTVTVGSIIQLIGAAVPFNTSFAQTAADLANAINQYEKNCGFEASASGAVVTVRAPLGTGAMFNGVALAATATTLTATSSGNFGSGVDSANGLRFSVAASGILEKLTAQTWSGVAGASGTAGWFRFVGAIADSGAADSAAEFVRIDGNIATSGADMNMTSTSITATALQTLSTCRFTMPAQ